MRLLLACDSAEANRFPGGDLRFKEVSRTVASPLGLIAVLTGVISGGLSRPRFSASQTGIDHVIVLLSFV